MFMREPQPSRAFEWTQAPWGAILRCVPLGASADHFFTAKNLTLRDNPDEWEAVATAMQVAREDILLVRQVHASTVAIASADRARPWPRPDADAIVSNDPSAAIAVRVADCVPILLAEETGRVVAAVHAGWRGTSKRAVIAAVDAMQARFGVRPERLLAAIGPSIGPCCYEVSESTREAFRDDGHHPTTLDQWFEPRPGGKFHLDLWRANRDQLEGAGVQPDCIHVAELCTKTHADVFHSYRVEGQNAGRMIAIVRAKA
jgi:purine-nucleoside/S-methyl-5'-thioadenosine phosphorylase / adenosine deaminase